MADLKPLARRIFQETLSGIDIVETMRRKLRGDGARIRCAEVSVDPSDYSAIRVVAFGKAAHAMVDGFAAAVGEGARFEGIASAPEKPAHALSGIRYFQGGHPVPTGESLAAAEAILTMLRECGEKTLVVFLLSGGGSALVEKLLIPGANLSDVQAMHRALVSCGAPIDEINAVRKHLSAVKGGRLATAAPIATKLSYAITDVPPGRESALASSPSIADPTTKNDAARIIERYHLREKFSAKLRDWLDTRRMTETPKPGDPVFAKSHFAILLGMDDLFASAQSAAGATGCVVACDNSTDDWPVVRAADTLMAKLAELQKANPGRRVAVIADGEVSSPVTGSGAGGRNSAFALACVEKIAGRRIAVLSAGTDGIDGNSPAAGAVADGDTLSRARAAGLDPQQAFQQSDAYGFFSRLGDAIVTGPTGNNLRDLRILLSEE